MASENQADNGETPLHKAAGEGDAERVQAPITAGADVNAKDITGKTPLLLAARYGRSETVRALINAGANINATNNDGYTPLLLAAGYGRSERVRTLVDAGADVCGITDFKILCSYCRELGACRVPSGKLYYDKDGFQTRHQAYYLAHGKRDEIMAIIKEVQQSRCP